MKPFIEQAQFYAAYHQNVQTRYTHMAGVPIIILSVMILLGFVKIIMPGVFATNLACLGTLIALIYYFRLNWQLALALTPIMLILLLIANWFSQDGPTTLGVWSFVVLFIVGWGLQFYGHYLEGKKPAFMDNLSQALIAPLYLVAELFFMAGLMQSLKAQIYGTEKDTL
ncbi:transmembrane protein [Legionella steigerwaltii]|uniref:Transmembrane protein n=1 Tax=Legionella steigerwaltii TaxID=460 RepID=A0A378L3W1_9GAMM|nr:Mpo1-like protein [Legionella steigerwaltii]KTD69804.1 transmembrane protein [Legionella steigerwaltii]STY21464.1 transmembrane protein [Legionella steigerwaltii]